MYQTPHPHQTDFSLMDYSPPHPHEADIDLVAVVIPGDGKAVVRVGDRHEGVCCALPVSGHYTQGSPDTFCNGLPVVRIGDEASVSCLMHPVGHADGGSLISFVNSIGIHRYGDRVQYGGGEGEAVTASPDTFAG